MIMEQITTQCTGCRACEQLCPKHAIRMRPDREGFLTATIEQSLCIDCGLCQKRCPQNHTADLLQPAKRTIAARLKDDTLLYKAASGGAFAGIATWAIKNGYIVFGVRYDENLVVHHAKAETFDELDALLSSKYVQSDTRHTYEEVKSLLDDGRKVLYSGTGCQIGGLKAFLKKDYANLLTLDLICHGVPSPLLFSKYIDTLKERHGVDKISEYDFRDKRGGWGLGYKYKYKYNNCTADAYYMYFLKGYTYRECCYGCHYASTQRASDITIADYWGIEKEHPEVYDVRGVSLILLNSQRGTDIWKMVSPMFESIDSDIERAAKHNGNLKHPTERKASVRDHVYDGINELPATEYFRLRLPYKTPLKAKIKSLIPMKLLVCVKKWK